MKITHFRIENFRNLRLAECAQVPDFVVIAGGNGCGKSALLEALMTAKEYSGAYGNFSFDPRAVSADAARAEITLGLAFSDEERIFVEQRFRQTCPSEDEIVIEINRGGDARITKNSGPVSSLLRYYGRSPGSPGFFDFINAHRQMPKHALQTWDASSLSDEYTKQTLAMTENKFRTTKEYLAALTMRDLGGLQKARKEGNVYTQDSLEPIREQFIRFFAPMRFQEIRIYESPLAFVVSTPLGEIDIDDLSSGEKEILNIFVRFHQIQPHGAVILFDEADAHLHPDLERRYLQELRELTRGNQLLLTTHSPEMMIAAGADELFTVLKEPRITGDNQFVLVTGNSQLHEALAELMGSRGLVSVNQRIIFIEGEDSSADRAIYETLYPPSQYNVSFVPAGDSSMVAKTAERVNSLLTAAIGFQQFFSIVDKDINRIQVDPTNGTRLFKLPVYHVENFLLNEQEILAVTKAMLGQACPLTTSSGVATLLKQLVLSDAHIKPYTKALLDSRVAELAKKGNCPTNGW